MKKGQIFLITSLWGRRYPWGSGLVMNDDYIIKPDSTYGPQHVSSRGTSAEDSAQGFRDIDRVMTLWNLLVIFDPILKKVRQLAKQTKRQLFVEPAVPDAVWSYAGDAQSIWSASLRLISKKGWVLFQPVDTMNLGSRPALYHLWCDHGSGLFAQCQSILLITQTFGQSSILTQTWLDEHADPAVPVDHSAVRLDEDQELKNRLTWWSSISPVVAPGCVRFSFWYARWDLPSRTDTTSPVLTSHGYCGVPWKCAILVKKAIIGLPANIFFNSESDTGHHSQKEPYQSWCLLYRCFGEFDGGNQYHDGCSYREDSEAYKSREGDEFAHTGTVEMHYI